MSRTFMGKDSEPNQKKFGETRNWDRALLKRFADFGQVLNPGDGFEVRGLKWVLC